MAPGYAATASNARDASLGRAGAAGAAAAPPPDAPDIQRTKILMLGLRRSVLGPSCGVPYAVLTRVHRSGKTSIRQVLFDGMDGKQTFYLDKTNKIVKHTYECVTGR
jgi:Ras-related GTP-binding protein C/D